MPTELPADFVRRVTRRIAEVRRARGMTQEQLAEALDTGARNIQLLESGANLTLYRLARVAAALGVRPEELLAGDTHRPPPRSYDRERSGPPQALAERPTRGRAKK